MFVPMHVAMVTAMRLPVPRTKLRIPSVILCNILLASMAPPNIMAAMISQIVQSILDIPPRLSNSSSMAFPEFRTKPSNIAIHTPFSTATFLGRSVSPT